MNPRRKDIAIQIEWQKQIVACQNSLLLSVQGIQRMMNERGDEQASLLYSSRVPSAWECVQKEKLRLWKLTVRYEALRCDIMQQYLV